jgi:FtsP/CotA-like multicopper oxidase with cupredoxin domain
VNPQHATEPSAVDLARAGRHVLTRRRMVAAGAAAVAGGAAAFLGREAGAQVAGSSPPAGGQPSLPATQPDGGFSVRADPAAQDDDRQTRRPLPPGEPGTDYTPVVVPNGWTLPHKVVDGVKVFHLVAGEVYHEFAPGLRARCWGYNGSVHGPVIEAVDGDRVRVFVTNQLAAPTSVHWHGILLPSGMDGVGGLNQKAIRTGETFVYEFTLRQHGTFMYHAHHDEMTQMGMGLVGMFVVHPRGVPADRRPTRDFALMLHEWAIPVGAERPDPNVMSDFNVLTINAKAFPGTAPLVAKLGDKLRLRFGNLGAMDHHPIHLHGYAFRLTETDGGRIPEAGQWPETTVLVATGTTRTVEFVADAPGDWAMHCHMTHHVMNQMGHGLPNMIGVDPTGLDAKVRPLLPGYMTMGQDGMGDMAGMGMAVPANSIPMVGGAGPFDPITMGGMFTILKVREALPNGYDRDPGWYATPPGTVAALAPADVLARNGVAADGSTAPKPPPGVAVAPPQARPTQGHAKPHGDGHSDAPPATSQAATSPPAASAGGLFACPMHPEVIATRPGERCPKCGMVLVARNPGGSAPAGR